MTSAMLQLKTSYETLGMSPEEIAHDQQLELAAVKATLVHCSSKYRKDVGMSEEENDLDFSDDELRQVNKVIFETAIAAEDEGVRLKAAMYIRDDKKGRRELVKQIQGNNTFNVLQFNMQMKQAREATQEMIKKAKTALLVE